ncbi:MAG TPA: amidohydrolase family protein [Gemmatimonas sp.]|nr:amidohydrolase family protein [Gemmatimonas sp.]
MLTLIENGEIYAPQPLGRGSVLLLDGRIGKVGTVDRRAVEALDLEHQVIDATGCIVTPGLIDPHEHLLGGSGEGGFSTQTPEITLNEIVTAGVTSVVGALGVDTTMKTMAGLLARVKGLKEEGLSAFLWSGGYNVPPSTVTQSIRNDLMFIDEVVGAGEIAIADARGLCPQAPELAKLVLDTHVGGMLSGKAGVTHFHVGKHEQGLKRLRELLEGDFAITADMLYPTHINRSERLIDEAIALADQGAHVDMDTVDGELARWVQYYLEHGGRHEQLTISSDSGTTGPRKLFDEFRLAVTEARIPLETMLPMLTTNTAQVLRLKTKGQLKAGFDSDVLVMRGDSLEIVHVIARGTQMVKDGALIVHEGFLETIERTIDLVGQK